MFPRKIAIDLGTANFLLYLPGKGIVINEPCVVALDATDNKVVAMGGEAKLMLGKTPESIVAAHPLKDGVIANFKVTEAMLRYFINKVSGRLRLFRPEIMVAIPAGVTSTERRAVVDACISAGAKNAYVIKEPVAAALGAGIPIANPEGHMIIDMGAGSCDCAVISLGDTVAVSSIRVGGQKMDRAIANYIRKKYNLVIGDITAEEVKIKIGAALPLKKELSLEVSGSNSVTGLPESVIVTTLDVVEALKDVLDEIINSVKAVLQKTPPELASDVMDKGIVMTGGGALLRSFDQLLTKVTGVPCQLAEEPELCVVKGTAVALENLESYKKSVLWAK